MYLTEIICVIAVVFSFVGGGKSSEDYEHNVLFYLHTQSTVDTPQQLLINNISTLINSDFHTERKTLLVIHGYKNNLQSPIFQEIKNAALESLDANVIGVDWDHYTSNFNYGWVVANTKPVGIYISEFIEFLLANGLSESDVHLVGHSLGAHAAGFAGKRLRANGHPAARITGLDPALPGFYIIPDATARLNASDADYVDCIHTCGGILGIADPICQADFYPNRGQNVQPGCSIFDFGACSHGRSFEFFAESFNPTHLFSAKTCKYIAFWVPYNCHDEGAVMGYPAAIKRVTGLFSLTTNSKYPFAKNITATSNW